jgi:hypothetical protein
MVLIIKGVYNYIKPNAQFALNPLRCCGDFPYPLKPGYRHTLGRFPTMKSGLLPRRTRSTTEMRIPPPSFRE